MYQCIWNNQKDSCRGIEKGPFAYSKSHYMDQNKADDSGTNDYTKFLTKLGFMRTYSDASLYIYVCDDIQIIMPVFVDNMTLASKLEAALDTFMIELGKHFKMQDLGTTTQLLGIKIDHDHS